MFKGQGQTTLLNPVCCPLYILIPWLLASYRFCFYREDKPENCTMGGIDVSETFVLLKLAPGDFLKMFQNYISIL